MILSTALLCLAVNLYHEARGEPVLGQYAVAMVTMNRAGGNEERVCHEVFKPKQFSWTNQYVQKTQSGWKLHTRMKPKDETAWNRAYAIAQEVLAGKVQDFTKGARFYHATHVQPQWADAMVFVRQIGRHVFYAHPNKS